MPSTAPATPRWMLVAGAATLAATATYGLWIVRHGSDRRGPALGRCAVSSTHAVSVDPGAAGLRVVARGEDAWVLLAQGSAPGAPLRVQRVLMPARGPAHRDEPIEVAADPQGEIAADLVLTAEGPVTLTADARQVAAHGPSTATAQPTVTPWPVPPPVGALGLAAAPSAPSGPVVLLRQSAQDGGSRLVAVDARGVRSSQALAPRRRDRGAAPQVTVLGDRVWMAHAALRGGFDAPAPRLGGGQIVLAIAPADEPAAAPTHLVVSREATDARGPRLSPAVVSDPTRGAVVAWRDGAGIAAVRVSDEGPGRTWAPREFVRVSTDPDPTPTALVTLDIAPVGDACGHLVVWRAPSGLALRTAHLTRGALGPIAALPLVGDPLPDDARLRLVARTGGAVLAVDGPTGVRLYAVSLDAACTARIAALPALPRARGAQAPRLVDLVAGPDGVVLGTSPTPPLAAEGTLDLWRLADDAPAARLLGSYLVAMSPHSLSAGVDGALTVLGRHGDRLRLQSLQGAAWSEALTVGARDLDEAALSPATPAGRYWVAAVTGPAPAAPHGPFSAVAWRVATRPSDTAHTTMDGDRAVEAPFRRHTLDAFATATDGGAAPAWITTRSDAPDAAGCLPGAFVARWDAAFGPVALPGAQGMSANTRALLDPTTARCGDRVLSTALHDGVLLATVRRAAGDTLAVRADLRRDEAATPIALDPHPAVAVAHPAVAAGTRATLALWIDPVPGAPRIRARMLGPDGRPLGPPETLGEVMSEATLADPRRALPLAYAGDGRWVAVFPSARGPRLARIHCGE